MADRKTRYFILGAAAVLVVGLGAGLVGYYRGDLSSGVLASGPTLDDLRYVPDDASVIAYADVRAVMASEFRQRAKKLAHDPHGKDRFQDETGIDIEKDVDSAIACLLPNTEAGKLASTGFVVLRGRFDTGRIEASATNHGATVEAYNGRQLFITEHGPDHEHAGRLSFAFMEDGALLLGQERAVKAAIDRVDTGALQPSNEEVMRLIEEASAEATVWAVGRPQAIAPRELPGPVAAQVPQIKWFSATSRVNGGMAATFRAESVDQASAKNLRDAVTGMAALARMAAGDREEWAPVLQSLQIGGEGTMVNLSLTLPLSVIDRLAAEMMDQKRHAPPPPPGSPLPPDPPDPPRL